jgi:Aspartyl protease/PDZ domain
MRRFVLAASCAGLAAVVLAACRCARSPRLTGPVVVPFELRGDLIVVTVDVNGQPAALILDTGTGIGLALDSAFAQQAHFHPSWHNAQANGRTVRLGTVRSVHVGSAPLSNVGVVVVDIRTLQTRVGRDVHGTIGYDLFDQYVVTIDYEACTITLVEPGAFTYAGSGTVVPVGLEHHTPVVAASLVTRTRGVIPVRLDLDLGSSAYAVRLSLRTVAAYGLLHDTVTAHGPFGGGAGAATEGELLRMPSLRIGPLVINRPSTALAQEMEGPFGATAINDGTIGEPVLRRTRLIIDYSRSRVIMEQRGRFDLPDTVDGSGLSLASADSAGTAWRVLGVVAGSAGARAGVHPGDQVIGIDGVPAATLPYGRIRELLRADGVTRRLAVRREGATLDVPIALTMIF